MEVEFTTEAREDLFEAADYYEAKEKGLGQRIRGEFPRSFGQCRAHPFCGASAQRAIDVSIAQSSLITSPT